jgi:hypothetical protein
MTILMGKSYRALVAQALTCCYFVCALSLPLPKCAISEVDISRAR